MTLIATMAVPEPH